MPDFNYAFTDKEWQLVCQDATALIIQGQSINTQYLICDAGLDIPGPGRTGFDLPQGIQVQIHNFAALGGCMFVRSLSGKGSVRAHHDSTTGLPYAVPDYVDTDYFNP